MVIRDLAVGFFAVVVVPLGAVEWMQALTGL